VAASLRFCEEESLVPFAPTIGIITARPEEFSAVEALVDNSSWVLTVDGDGRPSYLAGTMRSAQPDVAHDVVVVRRTGATDDVVATSAAGLAAAFPTVGVVVICGIAAGVPGRDPRRHVAAGDIVVARNGFVVDDDVQVTDDGVGLRARADGPSPLLTAASDELRTAAHQRGLRPWEAWLEPAAVGLPAGFRRPEEPQCPLQTPRRRGRPNVYYGRIGGAVGSLRSSWVLEELAAGYDLRAVELAGRGMRTSAFPPGLEWFVVRGIAEDATVVTECDWRPAAALAAAAYTRALLGACLPVRHRDVTARPRLHIPRLRELRSGRLGRRLHGLHRQS